MTITKRPTHSNEYINAFGKTGLKLQKGNIKVGEIFTYSKLMGNKEYFYTAKDGTVHKLFGSCGSFCGSCEKACYVRKSYRYPSVVVGHCKTTLGVMLFLEEMMGDYFAQISNFNRKKVIPVRLDQSGEITSEKEFLAWCKLAENLPNQFYIYTKAFDYVEDALLSGKVPENVTVLSSIWHEYGIDEFMRVAHLPNVKAFVYDDHTFDYSKTKLAVFMGCKTCGRCMAYVDGKLNHELTCDKCKMCFNRVHKIIFCDDH